MHFSFEQRKSHACSGHRKTTKELSRLSEAQSEVRYLERAWRLEICAVCNVVHDENLIKWLNYLVRIPHSPS